jgi:hypothetical protein
MKRCTAALVAALCFTLLSALAPADAKPIMCGGAVPIAGNGSGKCSFAASGSQVYVEGAVATAGAVVTYSLLCPVCPTPAGVTVTITRAGGKKVARCSLAFVLAAACAKSSEGRVGRGTLLTCSVKAFGFVGVATYLCGNRG